MASRFLSNLSCLLISHCWLLVIKGEGSDYVTIMLIDCICASLDILSSLPPAWDSSQVSRADPDGAPSSSASSPTSAPPEKMASNRMNSVGSDEYQHRKRISETRAQQQQQPAQQREYKDYRSKYYDWAPDRDSSSNIEVKQTTVHPKVVYDIPKSSHVFVDANIHTAKPATVTSTPRSDNYRCVNNFCLISVLLRKII